MKNFLKTIFAAFLGVLIFTVVATFIGIIGLVGMMASVASSSSTSIKDGSVLMLKLDQLSGDRSSTPNPKDFLMGNKSGTVGLVETLSAIRKAKVNDNIKGIYIEGYGCGFDAAQVEELREGLLDFKKSGKWIIAYGDIYSTGDYYVSSAADKVYLNPQGELTWVGLAGFMPMMKNMYAKLGIRFLAFKCGKYKSATELYTEDHMSAAAREQEERVLSVIWNKICEAVSKSRGISVAALNSYADRVVTLEDQKNLVKYKMIDGLLYTDQIKDLIKKKLNLDEDDDIPQVTVDDMQGVEEKQDGGVVAVYYAGGEIYDEAPQYSFISDNAEYIVGNDMVDDLRELAGDDDVKAVVLRVNSPGGSSYASEQIWRAIELLKKKKPVVVSMGNYAASGGYYISSGANYIFADPLTETGSIGIYGLYDDGSDLLKNKMGLNFEEFKTNANSSIGAHATLLGGMLNVGITPLTPEQIAMEQASVDRGYLVFKSRVAQGRHLSMAQVEEIAQGHVYTGSDAIKIKLVDELGGLNKAVAKAAQLAKLEQYHAVDYPEAKDFLQQFIDAQEDSQGTYLDGHLRVLLGSYYEPLMQVNRIRCMGRLQALMPYRISINR